MSVTKRDIERFVESTVLDKEVKKRLIIKLTKSKFALSGIEFEKVFKIVKDLIQKEERMLN